MSKSSRASKRQDKQVKHKYDSLAPSNFFKIKSKRHDYYVVENKTELDTVVSAWTKKKGIFWD